MEQNDISSANDGLGEALNNILSNPQMMSIISGLAQKLKGESEESGGQITALEEKEDVPAPTSTKNLPEAIGALAPLLSNELRNKARTDDKRACLLRALKPYMSDGRKEAIEYIIKISMISDVLKNLS